MAIIDKIDSFLEKIGLARATKSYEALWSMAKEARIFGEAVTEEYSQIPTVYKAIKAIADNASQAELKFFGRMSEEEIPIERNPDLKRLFLDKPNPLMSFNELLEATIVFYGLFGEAFWIFETSTGQVAGTSRIPAEIWTFTPKDFKEQVNKQTNELVKWKFRQTEYEVDQVMHFNDFNPYNPFRGLSRLSPARNTIDIDWQSLLYNKAFFKNDATPSFVLSTDKALGEKQRTRLREWWNKEYRGTNKSFKMAVLEAGLKPQTISHSSKDMQFIDQRKLLREELLGIWRVPKSMFSITDDLNYATFIGQKKVFWTDTIMPILNKLESELNAQFFAKYMPDIVCRFDYSNVDALKEELKDKLESAQKLFSMGVNVRAINEKLELGFDEEDLPEGGYLPFSVVPVGGYEEQPKEDKPKDDKKDEKSVTARAKVMSERIWKGFLQLHNPIEEKMLKKVSRFLYEQRSQILARIHEKAVTKEIEFTFDWQGESEKFVKMMKPLVLEGAFAGVDFAESIAGGDVDALVMEGSLRSWVGVKVNGLKTISETFHKEVEREIAEGVRLGETITQVADRLRSYYNGASWKALRIARTETTGALNFGSMKYYEKVGAKTKTWLTAGDEHVRSSHAQQHGMTVDVDKAFPNGLMYPSGDGDPYEAINCRCTLITRETF